MVAWFNCLWRVQKFRREIWTFLQYHSSSSKLFWSKEGFKLEGACCMRTWKWIAGGIFWVPKYTLFFHIHQYPFPYFSITQAYIIPSQAWILNLGIIYYFYVSLILNIVCGYEIYLWIALTCVYLIRKVQNLKRIQV